MLLANVWGAPVALDVSLLVEGVGKISCLPSQRMVIPPFARTTVY